jgi:5'-3' exonuclease
MTIGDLWDIVKETKRIVPVQELNRTYGVKKIAVDAVLVIVKHYCAIWSANLLRLTKEQCLAIVIENLVGMAGNLSRSNISIIWCFDGVKSEHKLATDKRKQEKEGRFHDIIDLYKVVRNNGTAFARTCSMLLGDYDALLEPTEVAKASSAIAEAVATATSTVAEEAPATPVAPVVDAEAIAVDNQRLLQKLKNYPMFPNGMIEAVFDNLSRRNLPCVKVDAISEAEKLCCILAKLDYVQAVYSTDSDLIPLGAPIIIKEFDDGNAHIFLNTDILNFLSLPQERIIDLSIILGTDFNERVKGYGKVTSLKLVRDSKFKVEDFEAKYGKDVVKVDICREFLSISDNELQLVRKSMQ